MRRGAARPTADEWEKQSLGGNMDDYFGPEEKDHGAEDAYEWGWMASSEFHRERITQLEQEVDRLNTEIANIIAATSRCSVVYMDTSERPAMHILCKLDAGHDGCHRGVDKDRGYGVTWTTERRFKVYDGQRDDIIQEPA